MAALITADAAEFAATAPHGRLAGLDVGSRTVGLAVCDAALTFAGPSETIRRTKFTQDLEQLRTFIERERVVGLIIGLPLNMDGSHGASAKAAIADARRLATVVGVPIELHDERRTTVTAEQSMREAGLDGVERRQRVDKVAAAIMLQSWLDGRSSR